MGTQAPKTVIPGLDRRRVQRVVAALKARPGDAELREAVELLRELVVMGKAALLTARTESTPLTADQIAIVREYQDWCRAELAAAQGDPEAAEFWAAAVAKADRLLPREEQPS